MRRKLAATSAVALLLALVGWVAGGGTLAAFQSTTGNTGNTFSASNDFQAPTVTASVIAATSSGAPVGGAGWVHQGGTYKVYANATDNVSTGAGITLTANVSPNVNGTGTGVGATGDTAVPLTFNSTGVAVGGTTYHYISAEKAAANPLAATAANAKSHQITATDAASNSASTMFTNTGVDNTVPAQPNLTLPGANLRSTVTLSSTSTDTGGSGAASVAYERSAHNANTFTSACVGSTSPFSCSFDTTTVSDGSYDFRSSVTDNAGNVSTVSATQTALIDNTAPTAPTLALGGGATLTDSVTYSGSSTDAGSGMNRIELQAAPTGTTSWVTVCSVTGASATLANSATPCTNALDSKTVIPTDSQGYDFRAVAFDNAGNSTASNVLTRTVDNSPFAVDIQANTGGNNTPNSGDTLTYTFSEPVTASSILSGFTGAATSVNLRFDNSNTIQVSNAADSALINLGSVNTVSKFVTGGQCTYEKFAGTMSMSGSVLTISFTDNGTSNPAGKCTVAAANTVGVTTFAWTPSASVTDSSAHAMKTTTATESGAADADF